MTLWKTGFGIKMTNQWRFIFVLYLTFCLVCGSRRIRGLVNKWDGKQVNKKAKRFNVQSSAFKVFKNNKKGGG